MILEDITLFPHCILPLRIFEPRYRAMLNFALESDRMFVIANLDKGSSKSAGGEVPCNVGTAAIIKISKQLEDKTSHLVLEGIMRVSLSSLIHSHTFPYMQVRPLLSTLGHPEEEMAQEKENLLKLVSTLIEKNDKIPPNVLTFLEDIDTPEALVDLTAYAFCAEPDVKQRVLETLKVKDKYTIVKLDILRQIHQLQTKENLDQEIDENPSEFN